MLRMVLQETFVVTDGFNSDDGTTENTDWVYNSTNLSVTPSTTGKTVVNNTSIQQAFDLNRHDTTTTTTYDFNIPFSIEMDIVSMSGEVRFQVNNSSNQVDRVDLTDITGKHLKIEFKDNTYCYYLDGVKQGSDRTNHVTGDCRFRIILTGNASFKFKDFVIYPI